MRIAAETNASIVGGLLWDVGDAQPRHYCGYITKEDEYILNFYNLDKLAYKFIDGLRYCACRFTENFFLGKAADFRHHNIKWDDNLILMEHEDFFIRFPEQLRIVNTPDVYIKHYCSYQHNGRDPAYSKFRYDQIHRTRTKQKYNLSGDFFKSRYVEHDWTDWRFPTIK